MSLPDDALEALSGALVMMESRIGEAVRAGQAAGQADAPVGA
jgi:hypothetical protein